MKKLLVPALTLAAGFAGGWFVRKSAMPLPAGAPAAAAESAAAVAPSQTSPIPGAAPDKSPAGKAAAQASLTACRDLLKTEKNPARASVKILTMLDGMDAAAITALAGQVSSTSDGWNDEQSGVLMNLVFTKLAELDAPAALQTAMQTKDLWSRMRATGAVIEQMARTNPDAAAAAVEKFPAGYLKRQLVANLASTLAQRDGPAAIAILQRMKVPPNDWVWSRMFGSWANQDPRGAAAQLLTLPRQAGSELTSSPLPLEQPTAMTDA